MSEDVRWAVQELTEEERAALAAAACCQSESRARDGWGDGGEKP